MNKQYDEWQDTVGNLTTDKYDNDFKKINGLKWLPWVGKNYGSTKIFVLGASHYEWIKEGKKGYQDMKDFIESKEFTRGIVANHGVVSPKSPTKGFGSFRKCILNQKEPSLEAREELWSSILFHNLLQAPMVKSKMTYAQDDSGAQAWEVFKKLVSIFKPEICIAWGVEVIDHWVWKNKFPEFNNAYTYKDKIGRTPPREAVITIDGHKLSICVIQHPSYIFFSHAKWRDYLLTQYKDKLQKIITS